LIRKWRKLFVDSKDLSDVEAKRKLAEFGKRFERRPNEVPSVLTRIREDGHAERMAAGDSMWSGWRTTEAEQ
jgi:hypothetical protein